MVKMFNQGPASLIAATFNDLYIGEIIDEMVHWDSLQCNLSPGTRIKALIINIFGQKKPLYRLPEFFKNDRY